MKSLKDTRSKTGYTQQELAARTDIPQQHISQIELGRHNPAPITRERIENILGPIDWIETEGIVLHSADWYKAERLVKKLVAMTLAMDKKEKTELTKLISKYFKN